MTISYKYLNKWYIWTKYKVLEHGSNCKSRKPHNDSLKENSENYALDWEGENIVK